MGKAQMIVSPFEFLCTKIILFIYNTGIYIFRVSLV